MQLLSGKYLGMWSLMIAQLANLRNHLFSWCTTRQNALFPAPLAGLFKVSVHNVDF
jgi:hypothetical protein